MGVSRAAHTFVGGVRVDSLTQAELHTIIANAAATRQRRIILNANARAVALAQIMPEFRSVLNAADVVFCDGFGVKWASRWLGAELPERITYADWVYPFAAFSEREQLNWFFLGGAPGIAERAAARLMAQYPHLNIVGCHHGYFDRNGAENERVVELINSARPDVTFVGFGMPAQELWIGRHAPRLHTWVLLSAGACFDYVAGSVRRGPRWMTDHGFEWLARIVIEPRRLFWRYLRDNTVFAWAVFKQLLHQKVARRP